MKYFPTSLTKDEELDQYFGDDSHLLDPLTTKEYLQ